jgi:hypothetical protein
MRLFQNNGLYPSYRERFDRLAANVHGFEGRRRAFLDDRFGAMHFLQPMLNGDADAFFTNGDDNILQSQWARENGMRVDASLEDILLAQIEHHRAEVFYNLDPVRYPSAFIRKLPACVKKTMCWRSAPSGLADLTAYDAVLGNFPSILESWRRKGCRAELFFPAIDPVMFEYGNGERPIDILFVGSYSRHHSRRSKILERVASLADTRHVIYCLDAARLTRLAESPLGRLLPLRKYRRPNEIAKIAKPSVFGRELYELIGRSKIVLNGAIDMAGEDRGNMRCFEAMGCGALLLSDAGNYPEGMIAGVTMETYGSADQALELASTHLDNAASVEIAARGRHQISRIYTKSWQWSQFADLVARC